jgi:transcriptional regulator with GAF, ATPase, and Fis domain
VHPRDRARVIDVDPQGAVIGREPGPQGIEVSHSTVSRRHFEIACDATSGIHVGSDLGSHNGSWINGQAAGRPPRVLASGDVLRLGEIVAVFECGDTAPGDEASVDRDAVPGASAAARRLRTEIVRAAEERVPVLLIGESGTGKEWVAKEIHRLSGRGTLVVANCAALSATLVESQLFGHERGAFTGAARSHPGLFRSAAGGSLVLDEIGELPLELQPKLLRAVELREVAPLGGSETFEVDVRIIAATNRELVAEVEGGRFRRDLYARLSVVLVRVPPLRARRADLLGWIDRLHRRWSAARDGRERPPFELTAETVEVLLLHRWPENLRGLDHVVHELAALPEGRKIARADLMHALPGAADAWRSTPGERTGVPQERPAESPVEPEANDEPETTRRDKPSRDELLAALTQHQWNIVAVARWYGRNRRQVYRWMDDFGIEPPR